MQLWQDASKNHANSDRAATEARQARAGVGGGLVFRGGGLYAAAV